MRLVLTFVAAAMIFSLANERCSRQSGSVDNLSDMAGSGASSDRERAHKDAPAARTRPAAVQISPRPVILVGTAVFFVGFVVLLPFYSWLGEHHHRVWLWTCLAGWVLGLVGLTLMRKHRREGRTI
jgi:hypothetical protein